MTLDRVLGRSDELAVIGEVIDRFPDGPRGLVLAGEAGIGKTVLWAKSPTATTRSRSTSRRPSSRRSRASSRPRAADRPVATFLVERYWPGVTAVAAAAATATLARPGMRVVETIVAAPDEVCFWYVDAASPDEVRAAFATAGVPIDRVSAATALPDLAATRGR